MRSRDDWHLKPFKPNESGVTAETKQKLLVEGHRSLSHLGGREGLTEALRTEGHSWLHLDKDSQWVVLRREECRSHSLRGMTKPETRHLPRPLSAGDVIGVDLKKVKPPGRADAWIMMIACDFTSNRVWAWDLDESEQERVREHQSIPEQYLRTLYSSAV